MLPMTTPDQQATRLWKMQFTSTPKCIALVRRQVGKALADWGYGQDDIDRTLLVCGELATSAVQHGHRAGRLFEVQVAAERTDCLVEVSDPNLGSLAPSRPVRMTNTVAVYSSSPPSRRRPATARATRSARPSGPACSSPSRRRRPMHALIAAPFQEHHLLVRPGSGKAVSFNLHPVTRRRWVA